MTLNVINLQKAIVLESLWSNSQEEEIVAGSLGSGCSVWIPTPSGFLMTMEQLFARAHWGHELL